MKRQRPWKISVLVMALLLSHASFQLFGQHRRFVHIDARQGLSHAHVKAIYRDKSGFLWIGTESGLNRFDGYAIKVFRNDASDPATETFSRPLQGFQPYSVRKPAKLRVVVPDNKGNHWFLVQDEGLICYNEKSKKAFSIKHSDRDTTSIASNDVTAIAQQSDGIYWLAHSNGMVENMALEKQAVRVIKRHNLFYDRTNMQYASKMRMD